MHFATVIICLFCAFVGFQANAQTPKKIALVIGNADYRNVSRLANPTNDAADVEASFKRIGFTVTRIANANYDAMRRAVGDFTRQARGAEMAVVFYAGHGMEIAGENWLIPTDAELQSDTSAETEAINLKTLTLAVSNTTSLGLVMLDACRNNPFVSRMQRTNRIRSVDRGFARIEPNENVVVVYAAKDGTTAADGSGRNSPFTKALLEHVEAPSLEIIQLFRTIRDDVMTATKNEQQPFVYGSLSKRLVYFKPPVAGGMSLAEDDVRWRMLKAAVASAEFDDLMSVSLKRVAEARAIEQFLRDHPKGKNAPEAAARLQALKALVATHPPSPTATEDEAAWRSLLDVRSGKMFAELSVSKRLEAENRGLEEFRAKFPQSRNRRDAEARLIELKGLMAQNPSPSYEEEVAWRALAELEAGKIFRNMPEQQRLVVEASSLEEFIRRFPNSQRLADAKLRIDRLEKLLSQKLSAAGGTTNVAALADEEHFISTLQTTPQPLSARQRERLAEIAGRRASLDLEIPFDYNSATISPQAVPVLRALGRVLSQSEFAGATFVVAGHSDASGRDEYNLSLSDRRADSVKRLLIEEFKLPASKLIAAGFGKHRLKNKANPLAQENRRVEIVKLSER